MNTSADVIEGSTTYLRIYFAGIIFVFVYNIGSGILRAVGDSKRPLYFLIVCCFLNIFLDILFVVYLKLGVKGAAFATVISQAVSALLVILSLTKSVDIYRLRPNKIRFYKSLLIAIVTIGLPAGLQSVMYGISNIIIQTSLNSLGTETVAAHTAFAKIDAIYWMISGAFSVSIITFIGQNYGARKFDRMKKSIKVCLFMDLIASLLLTTVMMVAGPYLLRLFTSDQEVIEIGMQIIHIIAPSYAHFHLYRNFVQLFTWYGQCGDSYVDDLRWCLCTAYFVDFPFCKNTFECYHHFDELSHLLGFHSSAVYHLFHVLSKEIFPPLYGRNRNAGRNKRIEKRQTNLGASS